MQSQTVMDFFVVKEQGRRAVESLMRFNGARHSKNREYVKGSESLHPVDYNQWLRFYSPLSEKGAA